MANAKARKQGEESGNESQNGDCQACAGLAAPETAGAVFCASCIVRGIAVYSNCQRVHGQTIGGTGVALYDTQEVRLKAGCHADRFRTHVYAAKSC